MDKKLSNSLKYNIDYIKYIFSDCGDIVYRDFFAGCNMCLVYVDNIINNVAVEESILTNLMNRSVMRGEGDSFIEKSLREVVSVKDVTKIYTFDDIVTAVLSGDTVILCDGANSAIQASTKGFPTRGVGTVQTEISVLGPKDAFNEAMAINIVLIRRRIKDSRLKLKRMKVGRKTKTDMALMYMEGIVNKEILKSIEKSIENVDIDGVYDSGYMEQLIEKNYKSPFPQIQITERPDKTASSLLSGRVALVVDNSPYVILLPAPLNEFFQSADDYYERWEIMSFIRFMRYVGAFIAVSLPGLFIALAVYNPSMLPVSLALKIAGSRQNVPFPTAAEILVMEIAFELLVEAGVRLPSPVSSTIGIAGGIIIGQAAVEAGIVSPVIIIVSALTAICTYIVPNTSFTAGIRIFKYIVIFLSSFFGLFGFWAGILLLIIHLSSMESFGIPYLYPFCSSSENDYSDLKDSIFRLPLFMLKKRPVYAKRDNRVRQSGKEEK